MDRDDLLSRRVRAARDEFYANRARFERAARRERVVVYATTAVVAGAFLWLVWDQLH